MRLIIALIAVIASNVACTSTYHPEYHPVTVTTVHQAGAVAQPIVVEQPVLADPNVVFGR